MTVNVIAEFNSAASVGRSPGMGTVWVVVGEYEILDETPRPSDDPRMLKIVGPVDWPVVISCGEQLERVFRSLGHSVQTHDCADD